MLVNKSLSIVTSSPFCNLSKFLKLGISIGTIESYLIVEATGKIIYTYNDSNDDWDSDYDWDSDDSWDSGDTDWDSDWKLNLF